MYRVSLVCYCCFSLVVIFFLCVFNLFCLISICLGMFFLGFILYGTLLLEFDWLFPLLGKISTIISLPNFFSFIFFYSSFSWTPIFECWHIWYCPRGLWDCPQLFSFFLLYSALQQLFILFYLPAYLLILLFQIFFYWFLLEYFKFQQLHCLSLYVYFLFLLGLY